MRDIPQEPWTEDALKYVQKINESNTEYAMGSNVKYKNLENSLQLFTGVKDIDTDDDFGSTDVGDVSQITPVTGGDIKMISVNHSAETSVLWP